MGLEGIRGKQHFRSLAVFSFRRARTSCCVLVHLTNSTFPGTTFRKLYTTQTLKGCAHGASFPGSGVTMTWDRRPHKLDGKGRPRSRRTGGPWREVPLGRQRPQAPPTSQPPSPRGARAGSRGAPAPGFLLPRDEGSRATVSGVRATRSFGESKTLRRLSSAPGRCQARIQGSRSHSPPRQGRGREERSAR